jgi:hypothetical protein
MEGLMANVPVNTEHTLVMQNQTTGQVDYLKFNGATLVGSSLHDYGIAGWTVVANGDFNGDGHPDLVVQNQSTGFLDFLFLNASANLIGSAVSNVSVPTVHGGGFYGFATGAGSSIDLVSQLPNGQLDFLALSTAGTLIRSALVPGTVGLPTAIGSIDANDPINLPAFQAVGSGNDNVVVQLPDGSIDVLGFTGNINAGLTFSASFLLPASAGNPHLSILNQDFSPFGVDEGTTATGATNSLQGVEMVGTVGSQPDLLYFNSGYGDTLPHKGVEVGTLLENFSIPSGWQLVDAGIVSHTDIFPLS